MPELPEVEAARSAIAEHCIGKKIVRAVIANDTKVIDGVSPSQFEASILNKTILAAHRKGKNLWLHFDSPPFPSFQFGMTGAIYIKGVAVTKYKRSAINDADEWPSKFSKFFIELDDGLELSFTDKRRFAKVRLLDDPTSVAPISELGPDALLEPMAEDEFFKALSKKKIAIKTLLLDQSFISGIGNWVADEVLYQARIHPLQIASSLSKEDSARLLKCIKEVIRDAVEVVADSDQFPFVWLFHFRWGKKPGKVDGKKIEFINVGGRTTAYVPELQKLSGAQATKAAAKPRKQASKTNSDNDDDDDDDGDDNDDDDGDSGSEKEERANAKRHPKNSKGGGKQPPRKQKTAKTGDDSDDNDDKKMAPAKRKSQRMGGNKNANESKKSEGTAKNARTEAEPEEDDVSDAGDDNNDGSVGQKRRKTQGRKPLAKKQTSKKVK